MLKASDFTAIGNKNETNIASPRIATKPWPAWADLDALITSMSQFDGYVRVCAWWARGKVDVDVTTAAQLDDGLPYRSAKKVIARLPAADWSNQSLQAIVDQKYRYSKGVPSGLHVSYGFWHKVVRPMECTADTCRFLTFGYPKAEELWAKALHYHMEHLPLRSSKPLPSLYFNMTAKLTDASGSLRYVFDSPPHSYHAPLIRTISIPDNGCELPRSASA